MKKPLFLILLGLSFTLFSCIGNRYSYKRKGEEVHLIFNHIKDSIWPEHLEMQSIFAMADASPKSRGLEAAVALPFLFRVSYNQVDKALEHEDKKQTSIYFSSSSDDWFYLNTEVKSPVNLKNIVFYRTIKTKKSENDTAVVIQLGLQRSWDGLFLRFVLERLKVYYSKAKLPMNDDRLDMDITLNLSSYSVQKDNSGSDVSPEPFTLTVYNIPFRKELKPEILKSYVTPWFPVVPRSYLAEDKLGTGNFGISIKVTEYAEYGEQVVKINEKLNLEGNKSEINNLIDEIKQKKE